MKVSEFFLLNISFYTLSFTTGNALIHVLKWILIVLCFGLIVIRIMENVGKDSHEVTIDASGLNTIMRVVAFLGGGVICFAISAVYNKINKNEEVS